MNRRVKRIKPRYWSRPRRRKSRIRRFAHGSLTAMTVTVILLGVGAIIGKAAKPYLVGHREAKKITEIKWQIDKLESENRELKKEIDYLSTPSGLEVEARKLGWVKQGEIAVVVERPQDEEGVGESAKRGRGSFWRGIAGLLGGHKTENGSR